MRNDHFIVGLGQPIETCFRCHGENTEYRLIKIVPSSSTNASNNFESGNYDLQIVNLNKTNVTHFFHQ